MKMKNIVCSLVILLSILENVYAVSIGYSPRGIVIDGKPRILMSGSIHYPRSTPEMWPDLIQKAKDGGIDVIETYIFWNGHEPTQGQFNFYGRYDLVGFIKTVQRAGLYAHLRIGPYVCAEWNYGGFPVWLHFIQGIKFRTDNEPFKAEMQRFTTKIVNMMKQEKLFASQGGPIILSQIENEYGVVSWYYGNAGKSYLNWAAEMALKLDTGVPWVMCKQPDAPQDILDACNGFYCDSYTPNYYKKPKMWTENWTGWFQLFGEPAPYRPAEDVAFSVGRFIQRGGTFQNYYMYHGGTNFGRTSGGPLIVTSYDYDAPIDEYGLLREPKWGHLKELHKAIKLCETALTLANPKYSSLGRGLEAYVYSPKSGICAALLSNTNTNGGANVKFNGNSYYLPAWSISILPDCKNVAFNTAKVGSQTVSIKPKLAKMLSVGTDGLLEAGASWTWLSEPVGASGRNTFSKFGVVEQINTTGDSSDYLWYSISLNIDNAGQNPQIYVHSLGHAVHIFVNDELAGTGTDSSNISIQKPISLKSGANKIDLLSMTFGLKNVGPFYDRDGAGITAPVIIKGLKGGDLDLSSKKWTYQIGLKGEKFEVYNGKSTNYARWRAQNLPMYKPLIWYKTYFDAPCGNDPVSLDLSSMGKGIAWVNGESIGRYWASKIAYRNGCSDHCDYRGTFKEYKCRKGCGQPSQARYHVPRSWIKPSGNVLILLEEMGGDPTKVTFLTHSEATLCARITEDYAAPVDLWSQMQLQQGSRELHAPKPQVRFSCPSPAHSISAIKFASFGTPKGNCGSFSHGTCHSERALPILQKECLGKHSCSVEVSIEKFGDPCLNILKDLAVEALCSST